MNENEEIRKVYSAADLFEAERMRYLLAESNINSKVIGGNLQSIIGELPAQLSAPELWVRTEDYDKAKQLVDREVAELREEKVQRSDWICPNCEEKNVAEFDVCWFCQSEDELNTL